MHPHLHWSSNPRAHKGSEGETAGLWPDHGRTTTSNQSTTTPNSSSKVKLPTPPGQPPAQTLEDGHPTWPPSTKTITIWLNIPLSPSPSLFFLAQTKFVCVPVPVLVALDPPHPNPRIVFSWNRLSRSNVALSPKLPTTPFSLLSYTKHPCIALPRTNIIHHTSAAIQFFQSFPPRSS